MLRRARQLVFIDVLCRVSNYTLGGGESKLGYKEHSFLHQKKIRKRRGQVSCQFSFPRKVENISSMT